MNIIKRRYDHKLFHFLGEQLFTWNIKLFSTRTRCSAGGSLSPYPFIVVVETLAIAIRQNQGIIIIRRIENEETKIMQYADDTTASLSDISSAELLFELLNFFKDISGLKITSKERVCGLGRPKRIKQNLLYQMA